MEKGRGKRVLQFFGDNREWELAWGERGVVRIFHHTENRFFF